MNRIAIFAHFDKNNLVADYVIYYLQELKKVVSKIVFVSDGTLEVNQRQKLEGLVEEVIANPHGQYDFGSFKLGFLHAKAQAMLDGVEELVFVNDSCYAPIFPFDEMFNKMAQASAGFWGVTKNFFGLDRSSSRVHLQSYFMVFRPQVFNSDAFVNFIHEIKTEVKKEDVITNYEIGLTQVLQAAGFDFVSYADDYPDKLDPILWAWKSLIQKNRVPFIKRNLLNFDKLEYVIPFGWRKIVGKTYPIELIDKDLQARRLSFSKLFKYISKKVKKLFS